MSMELEHKIALLYLPKIVEYNWKGKYILCIQEKNGLTICAEIYNPRYLQQQRKSQELHKIISLMQPQQPLEKSLCGQWTLLLSAYVLAPSAANLSHTLLGLQAQINKLISPASAYKCPLNIL